MKHYKFSLVKNNQLFFCSLILLLLTVSCKSKIYDEPIISLETYQIEEGFELQIAASEPFIEAPVSMDFDNKGRMWVVEMKGYMQNLEGTGSEMPNGTISILEDWDNDGITDHSKIFLDSLVLPRAIAHVYGGLLYAEPPNLWFVDIKDDKPQNKVLVDSLYSDGGNVEHQPNGLMMHVDNWIYNAKSNFRYQNKNGKWIKEPTTFRGQWGISKDNFGRLYYNTNSTQLIGDYVLPNTAIKNPFYRPTAAFGKKLTPNQNVFPLHPTSVNRGNEKGVLTKDSLLINVTSACGPLIYRGNAYPSYYMENAFVCAPEANLVKRHILNISADKITANQAISKKEFIASTDEGFRPVNLFNGPDGNMYVVDMHRGIIQDKAFLTPYLQKRYAQKKLDTIIGMGRILRVVNKGNNSIKVDDLNTFSNLELVDLLSSSNGWLRDRAQQLLIFNNDKAVVTRLKKILENVENPIAQIHALHTLNGLKVLDFTTLEKVLYSNSKSATISHALVLIEQFASQNRIPSILKIIEKQTLKNNPEIDLYILNALGDWISLSSDKFFPIILKLSNKYTNNLVYQESLISSLRGLEEAFLLFLNKKEDEVTISKLNEILLTTISNKNNNKKNFIYTQKSVGTDARTAGYNIFRNFCATCHGIDGEGIENLAPPLRDSEYVTESNERLALIILHGLSGPIHVNGELYDLGITMPGLANNPEFSDTDIKNIIEYLNNAFPGDSEKINIDKIKLLRNLKPKEADVYTENELLELKLE
ncbi:dehydrogenase [Pseudalgibacter alginicilyticus]|uniref:Dehydrogenase n=1 Tax=Pseudalgibacter alginicilyticus TaxID=1736674 RepID=A0A0N7HYX3_9FLAO|nr:c-type cytochrome [Pseudalgibacter alginicilyticus]ALJ06454.1 dehydrogenase [Pseudalgibacter alginicilyticus]